MLFNENLIKVKTFITLNPELVEKNEPPITTRIKKINDKFLGEFSKDKPIFEILLVIENNIFAKLFSKLKKIKKNEIIIKK